MGTTRIGRPAVAVGVIVLASTLLRFAVAQTFTIPWIAPDEMLYGLLGESLWTNGTLTIRGMASPYFSLLTPAVVGAGLRFGGLSNGVELAQLLQSLAMSSAAIPVYLWSRRLAPPRWAVGAAALSVLPPALAYSGLLMTEALFYPASVWALFALAAMLERPTLSRQGLFLLSVTAAAAVRMQALVLLPALAVAVALMAVMERRPIQRLVPLCAAICAAVAAMGALRLISPGSLGSAELLGGYATLGETTAVGSGTVAAVAWHLAGAAIMCLGIPMILAALLLVEGVRERLERPSTRAFAAIVGAYVPLLVLQVGLFATGRIDHVSQRYLLTALPPLFVAVAAWAGAGAPRPRRVVAGLTAGLVTVVAAAPVSALVPRTAVYDALATTSLIRLEGHDAWARAALVAATLVAGTLALLVPRRLVWILAVVVAVGLAATSIDAARVVERYSAAEQDAALGGVDERWLDKAAPGAVTLLVTGDRPSTADARTVFWNRSIVDVVRLPGAPGGVPPAPRTYPLDTDTGWILDRDGRPLRLPLVAAPSTVTLDGQPVAAAPAGTSVSPGLTVWRTGGAVRIALRSIGLLPNGDFSGQLLVLVPGCSRGRLEVTLIGKSGDPVDVTVNGRPWGRVQVPAGRTPTAVIPAPPYTDGSHACTFALTTAGYIGTTRIAFVR